MHTRWWILYPFYVQRQNDKIWPSNRKTYEHKVCCETNAAQTRHTELVPSRDSSKAPTATSERPHLKSFSNYSNHSIAALGHASRWVIPFIVSTHQKKTQTRVISASHTNHISFLQWRSARPSRVLSFLLCIGKKRIIFPGHNSLPAFQDFRRKRKLFLKLSIANLKFPKGYLQSSSLCALILHKVHFFVLAWKQLTGFHWFDTASSWNLAKNNQIFYG